MTEHIVPEELTGRRQWVAWRIGERDGKPSKFPYTPGTGKMAKSNSPATWRSYADACEAQRNGADGIGFMFSKDDPYAGVDLDKCRNPDTGAIASWAQRIVKRLNSYTEISPSGKGLHIIIRGTVPPGGNRTGNLPAAWNAGDGAEVEMYSERRYFTMTGNQLAGTPGETREGDGELKALHDELFGARTPQKPEPARPRLELDDDKFIERMAGASNGVKFEALWSGDIRGYPSPSEADQALLNILAYWTQGDRARMERLFGKSALGQRKKWRERPDYRNRTIDKALESLQQRAAGLSGPPSFFEGKTFIPLRLARAVAKGRTLAAGYDPKHDVKRQHPALMEYTDGVWKPAADLDVEAQKLLGEHVRDGRIGVQWGG